MQGHVMLRIAFTSCFNVRQFDDQPVWDWIREKNPNHLVLLGDSIYMDVPHPATRVEAMDAKQFSAHMHSLYHQQIHQPQFKRLAESMKPDRIWSIWDDHDFLWNDAFVEKFHGGKDQAEKVALSTAYQEAFRSALSKRLEAGSFPATPESVESAKSALSTPSVSLADGLWLHLPDSRTFRTKKYPSSSRSDMTVWGKDQKAALEETFKKSPDAIHILASSSVLQEYEQKYPADFAWLTSMAAKYKTLVISGDIHENKLMTYPTGHHRLYEATASGAAVKSMVIFGKRRSNYGLLDIDDQSIRISLFAQNKLQSDFSLRINRTSWNDEAI
jgi:alkaline phosphatase D